ncbi:MAG TPA: hypothetical protein VMV62_02265, partial [Candidatus Paceibacterota bacterium]|nr:hypothetical protein [Candidatus Paceibacterota bacterium]
AGVSTEPSLAPGAPSAPVSVSARLVQISTGPIVPGESVVDMKAASASSSPDVAVNYIERGSGNVFTYASPAGTLTRINNRTIPGIQSAAWLPGGATAYVRYLSGSDSSTINTYALAATSSSGFFLPQDLADMSVSATGLLTIASGINGSAVSLSRTDGTRSATLFTTPLSSIRASFAGKNQYLVFSKPAATLAGDAFLVDSAGRFSRIAGPLDGLVALASPSGKWVLVSYTQNGAMQMELINAVTGAVLPLPLATIADKCVWAADDSSIYCGIPVNPSASYAYPDDWYQGAAHFSDRIWKIDVVGRYEQLVLDFSQANKGDLDAEALALDPVKSLLVFINKNDGSLWSYSL